MWQKAIPVLFSVAILSCSQKPAVIDSKSQNRLDTIGDIVYQVSDTTSQLYIHHEECTECLDAYVDCGTVYLPDSVIRQMKLTFTSRGSTLVPSTHDLHLVGKDKISEELFGDSINYGELQGKKYLVTGKVVGIKGLGIVFRVDAYMEVK